MRARLAIRWFLLALLAALSFGLGGCKTSDEPENEAARPWNSPKYWEAGAPGMGMGGMMDRR